MKFTTLNKMPPGGYYFEQPEVKWKTPNPFLPLGMILDQIVKVRFQNPHAGLTPTKESALNDLEQFVCKRLEGNPRWCASEENKMAAAPRPQKKSCAFCGSRKRQ